ncbi:CotY/CotZ family spore coat protein [Neobacillus mesonae]|uniref:CotY/CotZ family spore coat protein n=1 Tax=Neobacillus mesonae TaxID=1193713 RepID=UPI00203D1EBD|nr:CotY/CotZ family spore coat protein [Neobacillus mesonae]MCM3569971.1 CotY/CotZ family spore coat protein [Neobacillus mesonae]
MGCGKSHHDMGSGNCVCQVVRAINDLQQAVAAEECQPCTSCFNEPLGSLVSPANADTRVFMLKTADGTPFSAFFSQDGNPFCLSVYFRVEDVFDNCCATLRVLEPTNITGTTETPVNLLNTTTKGGSGCCVNLGALCEVNNFNSTDECVTVDLSCFCAIQCIADVNLGICD